MVDILAFYFLLVLFVFFLIKKRILGIICLSVILLMVICDIVSFLLLNEHITYISILRTDLDMIKMSINIIPSIVILSIIGILVHIYIYMYTRNLNFKKNIWVLIIPVIFAFMYPHSFVAYKNVVKSFAKLYKYNNYDISKIFSDVGNQDRYIFLDEIYASKGKNLVVIYCESFDDAFIKRKVFEKETKHLRQLC